MCSPQFEFHGSQTQRQLKETLYDTIIDYFDKGKVSVDFIYQEHHINVLLQWLKKWKSQFCWLRFQLHKNTTPLFVSGPGKSFSTGQNQPFSLWF